MEKFKPKKSEKEVISIRMDKELLNKIDNLSYESDISRNEFITQAIQYAILHLEEK